MDLNIFDSTPSFNKYWNTEVLSEWTRFNEIYPRDNLSKYIKDEAYVINLDGYADLTHWIVFYVLKVQSCKLYNSKWLLQYL